MLHRLELPDRTPELLAGLGVRDGDLQQPLHAAGHLGGEPGCGDVESRIKHLARTPSACDDVLGWDLWIFQSDFIEWPRDVQRGCVGGLQTRGVRASDKQGEFAIEW